MGTIKIRNGSITMTVVKEDLTFYKRAGYQVVEEELPEKPEPESVITKESKPRAGASYAPVEKKPVKPKAADAEPAE